MQDWRGQTVLTVQEVAEVLNCSGQKVRDIIKAGALPHLRIGKSIRVTSRDLGKFLEPEPSFTLTELVKILNRLTAEDLGRLLKVESDESTEPTSSVVEFAQPDDSSPAAALARFADRWRLNTIKRGE